MTDENVVPLKKDFKSFSRLSDDPWIEVLHVSSVSKKMGSYSFRASDIAHLEDVGDDKSAIILRDGTTSILTLPHAELIKKIDEGASPTDLKEYCEIVAPVVEPTVGKPMEDGTFYLGRFKDKDGKEKDYFAAAEDEKDGNGKRLSLTFKQAAERARNSKAHGHDDWMVPTGSYDRNGEPDILNAIFNNKAKITGLDVTGSDPSGWYWSSSLGYDADSARVQRLSDGNQYFDAKSNDLSVRLVRSSTI